MEESRLSLYKLLEANFHNYEKIRLFLKSQVRSKSGHNSFPILLHCIFHQFICLYILLYLFNPNILYLNGWKDTLEIMILRFI